MTNKTIFPTQAIQNLYEPDAFYEHGDNPALKQFMKHAVENQREGKQL